MQPPQLLSASQDVRLALVKATGDIKLLFRSQHADPKHWSHFLAVPPGLKLAVRHTALGTLISEGPIDVYSTLEPQAAFHKRITFCLNLHNDAVKAMSYPPDAHKDELPDAEAIKALASTMALIEPGSYVYDIQQQDNNEVVTTIFEGRFIVNDDISNYETR